MKLTIIPSDGAVYKDNVSFSGLDLSTIPANVHALQWDNAAGSIEFKPESDFKKLPNEAISELPLWAIEAVSAWDSAKAAQLAIEEEKIRMLQSLSSSNDTPLTGEQLNGN